MFSFYEKKTHTVEIKETTHLTSWTIDDEIQLNQFNLQIDELRQKLEIEDGKASEHIEDFEEFIGLKEQIRVLEIKLKKMTHPQENAIANALSEKLPRDIFGYINSQIDRINHKLIISITSKTNTSHKIRLHDFFHNSGISVIITTTKNSDEIFDVLSFSILDYEKLHSWLIEPTTQFSMKYYPPLKLWGMLPTIWPSSAEAPHDNKKIMDSKENSSPFDPSPAEYKIIELSSQELKKLQAKYEQLKSQLAAYHSGSDKPRKALQYQIERIQADKRNLEYPEDEAISSTLNTLFPQFKETCLKATIARKAKQILISFYPCNNLARIKEIFDISCSDINIKYKKKEHLFNNEVILKFPVNQRELFLVSLKSVPCRSVALVKASAVNK